MNYRDALAYLYSLSDFERGGPFSHAPEENLPREARLLAALGNPQQRYSCTLIAGTKGKGSTAVYIERVLREAGLRTGLYTQPDLHTFRERMRVNGRLISEAEVAEMVSELRVVVEQIERLHEFGPYITYEVATALALLYFARQQVEHAVLEVGLGGRLDATNVTQPLVSVIASISYDHMQILGNTLTEIATEKAGIIKTGGIVVTSAQSPEALLAIAGVSHARQAKLVRVGALGDDPALAEVDAGLVPALSYRYTLEERAAEFQRFTVLAPEQVYSGLEIPLAGQHQLENATLALATLETLREKGVAWKIDALRRGLRNVFWPARIELVARDPTIVVDGAHNTDSMQKLLLALQSSFHWHRLFVVLGVARDKDLPGIVQALSAIDAVILTRMANPRAASIEQLQALFEQYAPRVQVYTSETSDAAMNLAADLAESADLICATGSLYLAAEVLRWAAAHGDQKAMEGIEGVDH
jgi:dihydrofolate synthase/folylpolyglutamate synthase